MEFGLFIQGYTPGPGAHDPDREHETFMKEVELVKAADRTGWKYVWLSEHHSLTEYSHMSASDVFMGYLAAETDRIHLSSGIFNLSPRVNHPVRNAERAAMLDHLTEGRFEFGTGRGAGSHEVATFNIKTTDSTRSEWDEVIWEIPKMWGTEFYTFKGEHFSVETPHNILPKPYGPGAHPPIWVACGSPSTFGKAGAHGIGAIGFNFSPIYDLKPQIEAYKEGIANCERPVGWYTNDNVMLTNAVLCTEDRDKARSIAIRPNRGYLYSLVCLYHDTFPKPEGVPTWPEPPLNMPPDLLDTAIEMGAVLCGNPEEVSEQVRAYEETGVDHVVFGMPNDLEYDEALEIIETFGTKVIPQFDKDPVHSTTRYRQKAVKPKLDYPWPPMPEKPAVYW
jgi:alkanesulfonate monooxygenase SsuD/methylene tetrahydromethanopterin reductase-like flavin-dependent oxidoreductase (luciferase family)